MQIIFLPFQSTQPFFSCALSIGNFDGVHQGHRFLLKRLSKEASQRNLPACLLTFEPHSKNRFSTEKPPRLSTLRDKLMLLSQTNLLDGVFIYRFSESFSRFSARDFVNEILIKRLKTQYLLVGEDFHFGANCEGNIAYLKQFPSFDVEAMPTALMDGQRISSSLVRACLRSGNLDLARNLLGEPYQISGKVAYGSQLGRTLGFPTANIHLLGTQPVLEGTFIAKACGTFGMKYGVANISNNPTLNLDQCYKLEMHLFDFAGFLYGQHITVYFEKKLRDAKRFFSLEDLVCQIRQDVAEARAYWHKH